MKCDICGKTPHTAARQAQIFGISIVAQKQKNISFLANVAGKLSGLFGSGQAVPKASREDTHQIPIEKTTESFDLTDVKEFVWGDDCHDIGVLDYSFQLIKSFGLNPSMSFLDLNAGFGGLCRKANEEFNVWTQGLEHDQYLAEKGMEKSVMQGKTKKAPIDHYSLEDFELKAKSYDGIIARDLLFKVRDKHRFMTQIHESLKHFGQVIITDMTFVKKEYNDNIDLISFWAETEGEFVFPNDFDSYISLFAHEDFSFDLRIRENISSNLSKQIRVQLAKILTRIQEKKPSQEFLRAIIKEISLWAARLKLIENGIIQANRFYLVKTSVKN